MAVSLPPFARCITVTSGDQDYRVLTGGIESSATPVLLIHGGGYDNSAVSWHLLFPQLATHRLVTAVDLPGFGTNAEVPPLDGPVAMAEFVANLLTSLNSPPVVVFGVSMGGDIALNLALGFPEKVAGLVLIAPGGLIRRMANLPAQFTSWLIAQLPDRVLWPLTRVANRFAEATLPHFVLEPDRLPRAVREGFLSEAGRPTAGRGYARYNQACLGPCRMRNDLSDQVADIAVPTLIVHGADDPMVPLASSAQAAERIPDCELVTLRDCGHWAQLEQPDEFWRAWQSFAQRRGFDPPGLD